MNKNEALKWALEALEGFCEYGYDRLECFEHITAIKEALAQPEFAIGDIRALRHRIHELEVEVIGYKQILDAQPEQEPVAYIRVSKTGNVMACAKTGDFYKLPDKTLLYTSPQPAPVQEPVAIRYDFDGYGYQYIDSGSGSNWQTRVQGEPLYTAPHPEQYPQIAINPEIVGYVAPQRTWVGLTHDEVNQFAAGCHLGKSVQGAIYEAEAKLKDKNTRGQE